MHIVGIVCEYNPFHNGHLYHLQKIKEKFPDSLIILVLNGYFLERGEISLITKEDKAKLALTYGVDLVVELPFIFGTQSADTFASISMKILATLKCEYVVFGSESNDLEILNKISDYTFKENKEYQEKIKYYLNEGLNYPTALAKALDINFSFLPNDLLGISYLKAIKQNNYQIKPILIKRTNSYHDTKEDDSNIVSASNIRLKLINNKDVSQYVPKKVINCLIKIDYSKLFSYLKYKIMTEKDLSIYLDVSEGIDNRLKKVINTCNNLDELINQTKSKRYTYNRLNRMLIHILIGLTKEDNKIVNLDYIKVIGFNKKGQEYLNSIKKVTAIPFTINKESLLYKYELLSSQIYDLITGSNTFEFEISTKPLFYKE